MSTVMGTNGSGTRVDLHLHSRASGTASNWWVRGLGAGVEARESYTPPEEAYRMVKRAGMDFVTLTDHETIEGTLDLAHHPDFFVGEEVSAVFPEDGSYVDVLVYGLDAGAHREAQARRGSVYELVDYLREAGLVHVLAHPMYGMPGAVTRESVEKRLVLFGLWEFINGSRPGEQNRLSQEISHRTGPLELRQLAARHGLPAPPHRRVAGTAGSDDHGGIYGGRTYTVAPPGIKSAGELLAALAAGEIRAAGKDGSAPNIVHTGFKIAAEALKERNGEATGVMRGLALHLPFLPAFGRATGPSEEKLLRYVPLLARRGEKEIRTALVRRYEERLSGALRGLGSGFPAVDFLSSVGDLIDGHLFIAPYVGVHGYFGREKKKAKTLRRELFPGREEDLKAGIFVDGLDGLGGDHAVTHEVAAMYRNLRSRAEKTRPGRLRLVGCGPGGDGEAAYLRPVASLPIPLHDELAVGVPSLLDVLEHVVEEDYDVLHVTTPGPLGLAALVSGVALGLPVVGAYHTEFGAYAKALSGDTFVAEIVDVAVRQFYERCSAVAVPSQTTALALRNRGYGIRHFEVLKNGVDTDLFSPERRSPGLHDSLGGGRTLLLYAGRVGREKNLESFAAGYRRLRRRRPDAHLVVAGDGPYRSELEAELGETATFTGLLRGEALARVFASCDIFVFPSLTNTPGRAVAEAQASGLPTVVYGTGGPRECILPGISGFVAAAGDEEKFFESVEKLLDDRKGRESMGHQARQFARTLGWDSVLDGLVGLHTRVAGLDGADGAAAPPRPDDRQKAGSP